MGDDPTWENRTAEKEDWLINVKNGFIEINSKIKKELRKTEEYIKVESKKIKAKTKEKIKKVEEFIKKEDNGITDKVEKN